MDQQSSSKNKIISTILSIAVVLMLIFSGPVRAITLGIEIEDEEVAAGEAVEITAKVDLHSNDIVPENLNFTIIIEDESNTYTCVFDIEGNKLTACPDFDVTSSGHNLIYYDTNTSLSGYGYGYGDEYTTLTTSFGYGYGYGYSYGYGYDDYSTSLKEDAEMTFKIIWTTPKVDEETDYSVSLEAKMNGGGNDFTYTTLLDNQGSFTVSPEEEPRGSYFIGLKPHIPDYDKKVKQLTDGLFLHIKNHVKGTCNQMKGIIERSEEGKVYTNTSQFQEQMKYMGLENVEAVMTNSFGEDVDPGEISKEIRSQIQSKLQNKKISKIENIKRNVEVITFIREDGTSISLIEITYEVDMGEYVLEIPKTVAATAEEIQGNFEVLIKDPVIMFSNTDISFAIESKTNEVESLVNESQSISISKLEEEQTQPEPAPPQEEEEEEEDEDEEPLPPAPTPEVTKEFPWVFWVIGFIVVAIFIIAFILIKKRSD
jgi:hypothetical protein